jgi:DNA adenine methylase
MSMGKTVTRYVEPFVGGGAVLFDILSNYNMNEVYISDINQELITTYICVRDNVDSLLELLSEYEKAYIPKEEDVRKEIFYAKRERFNILKTTGQQNMELAALFIFLNRTCFNGLYRVNSKGLYNVPMGSYKNPTICDEKNLQAVSKALQGVTIVCADYKQSAEFIDANTFAYFDPPYRPLNATSSFTSYSQDGFDDKAQAELALFIDQMSERGAYIVASNSDPKNVSESDDFFDTLYAKHKINRINATRMINSVSSKRGQIRELLIANY